MVHAWLAHGHSSDDDSTVVPEGLHVDDKVSLNGGNVYFIRLWLNDATRQVLANALGLLGVSAPERM